MNTQETNTYENFNSTNESLGSRGNSNLFSLRAYGSGILPVFVMKLTRFEELVENVVPWFIAVCLFVILWAVTGC